MASKVKSEKSGVPARRVGPRVATLGVSKPSPTKRRSTPVQRQYVDIDLHRRRSVMVGRTSEGETLETVRP